MILKTSTAPFKVAPSSVAFVEQQIGDTRYDNQSNASIPKRSSCLEDGTIGAHLTRVWMKVPFCRSRNRL
ncbi:MAG: hypothetical protein R2759_09230 [Bacteroidales bacterium]